MLDNNQTQRTMNWNWFEINMNLIYIKESFDNFQAQSSADVADVPVGQLDPGSPCS